MHYTNRRLNILLSNGLYFVSAKLHKKRPFAVIALTTFAEDVRLVFDIQSKKLLGDTKGAEIPKEDIPRVMEMLKIGGVETGF